MTTTSAAISLKPGPISLAATRKTPLPELAAMPKPDWSGSPRPPAAVIVLGRDDAGKPHASAFGEADAVQAKRAARRMGMALITVDPANADLIALAVGLPIGKVFASGKAFVPFVKGSTFDQLEPLITQSADDLANDPDAADPDENGGDAGGDEPSDDQPGEGSEGDTASDAATAPASPGSGSTASSSSDWSGIGKGSVVLAKEESEGAWYEATVIAEQGKGRFQLRWRDFDGYPRFQRRREELGLLHPRYEDA